MATSNTRTPKKTKTICCAYCKQAAPTARRVVADRNVYCSKLCAALGLIIAVDEEDSIDPDVGIDFLGHLVEDVLYEGRPILIPKKVRWSDADSDLPPAPLGCEYRPVIIDDEGTPDWVPEPTSLVHPENEDVDAAPSQAEIDRVVDDMLRNNDSLEGHS